MPKKILFDTVESVLKNEKFDDHQRKALLNSISNCRFSKLKYNQTELNEQVVLFYNFNFFLSQEEIFLS